MKKLQECLESKTGMSLEDLFRALDIEYKNEIQTI
jgi:hypothetical protein